MRAFIILILFLFVVLSVQSQQLSTRSKTYISVSLQGCIVGDTLILKVWDDLIGDGLSVGEKEGLVHKIFVLPLVDGKSRFTFASVGKYAYFDLIMKNRARGNPGERGGGLRNLFTSYLLEAGDDLQIYVDSTAYHNPDYQTGSVVKQARFSGRGSVKLICQYRTDSARIAFNKTNSSLRKAALDSDSDRVFQRIQYWKKEYQNFVRRINNQLQVLESFHHSFPEEIYNILRGNIIGTLQHLYRTVYGDYEEPENWVLKNRSASLPESKKIEAKRAISTYYKDSISQMPAIWNISNEGKTYSASFISMLVSKAKADVTMIFPEFKVYELINKQYKGILRDRILAWYLSGTAGRYNSIQRATDIQNALLIVKDPTSLGQLNRIRNTLSIGAPAYDFSLKNINNETISFNNLKGKVVFMDFWFTGCHSCASYYKDVLSKLEDHYQSDSGIVFVSVSIDNDMGDWVKSVKEGEYTSSSHFNVLNLYTNGMSGTHPIIEHYNVVAYPYPVVIDRLGRIAYISGKDLRIDGYEMIIKRIDKLLKK